MHIRDTAYIGAYPVFSLYTVYTPYIGDIAYVPVYAYTVYGPVYPYMQGYSLYTVHRPYIGDLAYVQACICLYTAYRANIGLYPGLGLILEQHRQSS